MTAIAVSDLRKSYGAVEAVKGISFDVAPGEVFALLGPNGAGKTTTVEILEGYRGRDGGAVSVLGFDPARGGVRFRERLGIVLQECGIEELLTPREALEPAVALERGELRPAVERDVRALLDPPDEIARHALRQAVGTHQDVHPAAAAGQEHGGLACGVPAAHHGDFPVAESVSQRTIALPFFTRLTEREIDLICQTLELMMTRASFSRS